MTTTSFDFIPRAWRPDKPRTFGLTEVRGPYYSTYGTRHLADVLDVAGQWVDGVKWAGGSFALLPREQVRAFSDLAHQHDAYISSGGWIETVLRYGPDAVVHYLKEAKEVGFDVIEISTGFLTIPTSGLLRLVEQVVKAGLKAKPELGIQFGSGGDSSIAELAAESKKDIGDLVDRGKQALDAVEHLCGRRHHERPRRPQRHVRGCRPARLRVVRQELRQRGQPLRRPLAGDPTRRATPEHLGQQVDLGPHRESRARQLIPSRTLNSEPVIAQRV